MTRTRTAPWDYERSRSIIGQEVTLIDIELCPHCGGNKYFSSRHGMRWPCPQCKLTDISIKWPGPQASGLRELIAEAEVNYRAHAIAQRDLELEEMCVAFADDNLQTARSTAAELSAQRKALLAAGNSAEAQVVGWRLGVVVMNIAYFERRLAMEVNKLLGAYLDYVKA